MLHLPTVDVATDAAAVTLVACRRSFSGTPALTDLSFRAERGAVTVLLGPNGAGKTTAARAITGAVALDAGSVRVFGMDPIQEGPEVRRRVGLVPANPGLYDRLSGRDNLRYAAALYGLRGDLTARIDAAAESLGIAGALDRWVGGYSTGMRTRLALTRALLHEPDLLVLDEPTSGLDPEASRSVLERIAALASGGVAVLMCTHLLSEADGLADHLVVLDDGRTLAEGHQDALARRFWPGCFVRIDTTEGVGLDGLASLPGVIDVTAADTEVPGVVVEVDDLKRTPSLARHLTDAGADVMRIEPIVPTLEQLYFRVRAEHLARRMPDEAMSR